MTNCKHYNEKRRNCNALKELYCKTKPPERCSFYCEKQYSMTTFSQRVGELIAERKYTECSNCVYAGIGVIPGHEEKGCFKRAIEGTCLFYNQHKAEFNGGAL